ncbi:Aste57867_17526 [Aphanomyces stellatus]|nr:hypothetical protein As57867_017466 [Aphanomyces stellatus]KAF0703701.1 hypothetical protein As57867_007534 [Aphanomyces stellatus]VFT84469.1 Aste57867_7560 [Aphanomyces stellatus]VFT94279.1 Aste57867_17526 [Aphanomyces stellatus]
MLVISTLLLAAVASAQPGSCRGEIDTAVYSAFYSCLAAVGNNRLAYQERQFLRRSPSFIREGACAGTYAPDCNAFLQLGSNSSYDCKHYYYKGDSFNGYVEAPKFCNPNGPSTHALLLSVHTDSGSFGLGVDGSTVVVKFLEDTPVTPMFDYDFANRDFQSNENGECLFV